MAVKINALEGLGTLLASSDAFIKEMHDLGAAPNRKKELTRVFSPGEAAEMVGRDRTTLGRAEAEMVVTIPARDPDTNRRVGYTFQQIQDFRRHFGTLPWRDPKLDQPFILDVQNLKGGTSKSTTCVNFAHYLALEGYRVLVVDTDSQATTTSFFGYIPDQDLEVKDTIAPFLLAERDSLDYAIRKTHWPNIDLIPSCLALADVEVIGIQHLATLESAEEKRDFFEDLQRGIQVVASRYDVVLFDTAPAIGVTSIMVLLAADAVIIPTTAQMPDYASTVQFFRMINNYIGQIAPDKEYYWMRVLITKFSRRGKVAKDKPTLQEQFADAMKKTLGDFRFSRMVFEATEIQAAAAIFTTPYEQDKPNRRILAALDEVFEEIELAVLQAWPSKTDLLSQRGIA